MTSLLLVLPTLCTCETTRALRDLLSCPSPNHKETEVQKGEAGCRRVVPTLAMACCPSSPLVALASQSPSWKGLSMLLLRLQPPHGEGVIEGFCLGVG